MSFEPVELQTADGLVLRGERWQAGDDWLVLAHDAGEDLDACRPLIGLAVHRGWSALALDLRGHGGSDDPWGEEACPRDVLAAIGEARARGARAVCAIGAGAGAGAVLRAAPEAGPDALVLLSPGPLPQGRREEFRGAGIAKLIVYGSHSPRSDAAASEVAAASIGPVLRVGVPTAARGTGLLSGPTAAQALEHIAAFWDEQRFLAGAPAGATRLVPPGLEAVARPDR